MALIRTITVGDGQIGIWRFAETVGELMSQIRLSDSEKAEFSKYSHEKRKIEWLAVRVMLGQLIGRDYSVAYTQTGKPLLTHQTYRYLSISHAREYAVVFVHQNAEVGIDMEYVGRSYTPVEKRYLSERELKSVRGNPLLQCLYWCAKEAIFKVVPHAGVEFKEDILIQDFKPEITGAFFAKFFQQGEQKDFKLNYTLLEDYGLVWVIDQ